MKFQNILAELEGKPTHSKMDQATKKENRSDGSPTRSNDVKSEGEGDVILDKEVVSALGEGEQNEEDDYCASQWPSFRLPVISSSEDETETENEKTTITSTVVTNPPVSDISDLQTQDINALPVQSTLTSKTALHDSVDSPIYVASSGSETDDDLDKTPENFPTDKDSTPPILYGDNNNNNNSNKKVSTSQETKSTINNEEPAKSPVISAPDLEMLKKCTWDSDLELSDNETTQIATPSSPSTPPQATSKPVPSPSPQKTPLEPPRIPAIRSSSSASVYDADEDSASDEEVWSQTKKKRFRFSFPG